MKKNLYAVYDEKSLTYAYNFYRLRHQEAIRYFADGCQQKDSMFYNHPGDYSLYFIGVFDDETAVTESVTPPHFLARASEFVNVVPTPVQA